MRYVATHSIEGVAAERWRSLELAQVDGEARACLLSSGRGEVYLRDDYRPGWSRRYWYDVAADRVAFEEVRDGPEVAGPSGNAETARALSSPSPVSRDDLYARAEELERQLAEAQDAVKMARRVLTLDADEAQRRVHVDYYRDMIKAILARRTPEAPHEPTAAMRLGTACHFAVLEPGMFEARYVTASH